MPIEPAGREERYAEGLALFARVSSEWDLDRLLSRFSEIGSPRDVIQERADPVIGYLMARMVTGLVGVESDVFKSAPASADPDLRIGSDDFSLGYVVGRVMLGTDELSAPYSGVSRVDAASVNDEKSAQRMALRHPSFIPTVDAIYETLIDPRWAQQLRDSPIAHMLSSAEASQKGSATQGAALMGFMAAISEAATVATARW